MSNTIPAKKVKRPGAGRTKGSFSFVAMTMEEVQKNFGAMPPTFKLLLSRKQVEGMGFSNLVTANVGELKESIAGQSVETVPTVHVEEL